MDEDRKLHWAQEVERGRQAESVQCLCEEWMKQREKDTLSKLVNATEAELLVIQLEYKSMLDFKSHVDRVVETGKRAQAKLREALQNG